MPSVCGCREPTSYIHRYFHQDKYHGDSSVPSVCDCRGLTNQFHKHFHHNKLHGDGSVAAVCNSMDRQVIYRDTSTIISTLDVISSSVLQSVDKRTTFTNTSNIFLDRRATYTDTSTRISSMEIALFLQSVAIVDRQATFTDTSTRISSMEVALCLRLVGPGRHRLKAQNYFHATYLSGTICKSVLLVHDSHRLKAQSYLHATYGSMAAVCD